MKSVGRSDALERRGLVIVGWVIIVIAAGWMVIALDPRPETNVAPDFRPLAVIVSIATTVAGGLTVMRRRGEMVVSILGALAGAAFAIATALLTRPDTRWTVYTASVVFGALLFGVSLFRGGFDRR